MDKKKILLHTCCAPCLSYSAQKLCEDGWEPFVYFFNPNIQPAEEYARRRDELIRFCKLLGYEFYVDENLNDEQLWLDSVKGLEKEPECGKRCSVCFDFRFRKSAKYAIENGFSIFTTTLTISPHKNTKVINAIGERVAQEYGIDFLCENFKKKDGFKKSLALSQKYNLFRQNYCGCGFSIR